MADQIILLVTSRQQVSEPVKAAAALLQKQIVQIPCPATALKCLSIFPNAVVIADQMIQNRPGVDLLRETLAIAPEAERLLVLDADARAEIAMDALNIARVTGFLRHPLEGLAQAKAVLSAALDQLPTNSTHRSPSPALHLVRNDETPATLSPQMERLCHLGEQVGGLIHQFNGMLTIVMAHLELLQQETTSTEFRVRLATAQEAITNGVDLIRTLQAFIRKEPVQKDELDLNQLIADTLKVAEPAWQQNERPADAAIQVETHLGDIPNFLGDAIKLREALTNLIMNAIDAMPQGGHLTVSTEDTGMGVELRVSDTGQGMPESVRQQIFEPFFSTKGGKGNGLGLSIVKKALREHGWDIQVESQIGNGTTFTIHLPVSHAYDHPAAIPLFAPSQKIAVF